MSSNQFRQGSGGQDAPRPPAQQPQYNNRSNEVQHIAYRAFMDISPNMQQQQVSASRDLSHQYSASAQDSVQQVFSFHGEEQHILRRFQEKTVYPTAQRASSSPQAAMHMQQSGLDGQSLYCTEVLPSSSPPSQPITVEGGGAGRRGVLAVNGGSGNQPVQYTIIITDPQLQPNNDSVSDVNHTSGATNILLSTLVQQQQQKIQQQQHQQQQQQHQQQQQPQQQQPLNPKTDCINDLVTNPGARVPAGNVFLSNLNGCSKLSNVLISNSNITSTSTALNKNNNINITYSNNLDNTSSVAYTTTADVNNINSLNNNLFDGKRVPASNLNILANSKLPSAIVDSEGNIVLVNYADSQLKASGTTVSNINHLLNAHNRSASIHLIPQNTDSTTNTTEKTTSSATSSTNTNNNKNNNNNLIRGASDIKNVHVRTDSHGRNSIHEFLNSDHLSQVNVEAGTTDSQTNDLTIYNGQTVALDRELLDRLTGADSGRRRKTSSSGSSTQSVPSVEQQRLSDSASPSNRVSGGMHSGRAGPGSGQTHNTQQQQQQQQQQQHHHHHHQQQQQQQQQHNPIIVGSSSSITSSSGSEVTSTPTVMLSAGQPAVPSGLFRTGPDSQAPSHRLPGSVSSAGYLPGQYSTIYGVHGQPAAGPLTNLQPYSTFFPQFGLSTGASAHGFSHGALLGPSSPAHFPQVESYSAILASMGSHVQHRGSQGVDRVAPRVPAPSVSVPQHPGTFLQSAAAAHMTAPGAQYPSIPPTSSSTSSSHQRLSGSSSPSPGPVGAASHNPTAAGPNMPGRLDPLSSHHLDKFSAHKGGGGGAHERRETDSSRELRHFRASGGEGSIAVEDKHALSPSGTSFASGHVPKVSFDSVVKEYGGGRDSPTSLRLDPRDLYSRTNLSGKEGSLKHRILTRPSVSEDDLSKVSGLHGLKDEPVSKRTKLASVGSAQMAYGSQRSHGHPQDHNNGHKQNVRHHSLANPSLTGTSGAGAGDSSRGSDGSALLSPGHQGPSAAAAGAASSSAASSSSSLLSSPHGYHQQHHVHPSEADNSDSSSSSRFSSKPAHPHTSSTFPSPPETTASSSSPPPPDNSNPSSHLQYPVHFLRGSIIQLANGTLKRVEDLQTEDFVNSAEISSDLKVDSSTVIRIEEFQDRGTAMLSFSVGEHRVQVTVEATLEHPFFVFRQGWSSCSVSRTLARYGLACQKLSVGDVCISLTHKDVNLKVAEISQQQQIGTSSQSPELHHRKPSPPTLAHNVHSVTTSSSFSSSASAVTLPVSSPSSSSSTSNIPGSLKLENPDSPASFPPPSPSSSSSPTSVPAVKRRASQTELPPPLSNIVPMKKENGNNHSGRRNSQNGANEVKEEEVMKEEEDTESTSTLRKRHWSAPDSGELKAEGERGRHMARGGEPHKSDESLGGGSSSETSRQ